MYAQEQTASESAQICPTLTSQPVPAEEHKGAALKELQKNSGDMLNSQLVHQNVGFGNINTRRKHQGNAFTFSRISLLQKGKTQFSPALPTKEYLRYIYINDCRITTKME